MEIKFILLLIIAGSIVYLIMTGNSRARPQAKTSGYSRPSIRIKGSAEFRQAVNEALDIIATTPSASVANRLTSITEARRDDADRRHAHVYSRRNCTIFPRGWREVSRLELAKTIVHEGAHIGTDGEAPALAAEERFSDEYRAASYSGASYQASSVSPTVSHGGALGPDDWGWNPPGDVGSEFTPRELAALDQSIRDDGGVYFTGENGQRLWAYGVGAGKGTVRAVNERGTAGRLLKMRRP